MCMCIAKSTRMCREKSPSQFWINWWGDHVHICTHTHLLCLLFCNNFFLMAMDQTFVFSFAKMVIVSICTGHVYNTDVCHHWLLHLEAPLLIVDFALKLLVLDILDHNLNRFSVLKNHSKSTFFFVFFFAEFVFHTLRTIQVCLGCNLEHLFIPHKNRVYWFFYSSMLMFAWNQYWQ